MTFHYDGIWVWFHPNVTLCSIDIFPWVYFVVHFLDQIIKYHKNFAWCGGVISGFLFYIKVSNEVAFQTLFLSILLFSLLCTTWNKYQSDDDIPLLKMLKWLPTALETKSKLWKMICKVPQGLTPIHFFSH